MIGRIRTMGSLNGDPRGSRVRRAGAGKPGQSVEPGEVLALAFP